jgi:hypothetical protein
VTATCLEMMQSLRTGEKRDVTEQQAVWAEPASSLV